MVGVIHVCTRQPGAAKALHSFSAHTGMLGPRTRSAAQRGAAEQIAQDHDDGNEHEPKRSKGDVPMQTLGATPAAATNLLYADRQRGTVLHFCFRV